MAHLNPPIIIAGGGLAGLSLGCALQKRGVAVTLLEAGNYPRHRVCGEFISGVSAETLDALEIRGLFADAHRHRSLAWHESGKLLHEDAFPEAAYGISRHRLDERMRVLFQSLGGELRTGTRARAEPAEGFVWAAGRRPRNGRWIGLKAHVKGLPRTADLEMHMGRNGYAGLAEVEDGWVNVCGIFQIDRQLPGKGADLLPAYLEAGGNRVLALALRDAEWREDSFSAVAGFELGHQPETPGLLCVGDSESMIPPFTGNGMSMAFQAAESATAPLVSWSRGEISWPQTCAAVRSGLKSRFSRRLRVAQTMHSVLLHPAGRATLQVLASTRLLPFKPFLSLIR